ncbi:hypothetical protein [Salinibaculum rarum]|uniref:hypothetical protein n=1 Tax=Salinibaculum rarum TaxID=3058903 RepID=UPI00265ED393|nr:hypothetical protein [Salinibaculum sp. KK48]
MTEFAVMVGDSPYGPKKTRFVGRVQNQPFNEETSHLDSSLDYAATAVRKAIRESLRFDHNVAKVTDGALLFQLGRETTYAWSNIFQESTSDECTIGPGLTWADGFPHPPSARISSSPQRYTMFAVDKSSMPNEWYYVGEKIGETAGIALQALLRDRVDVIEQFRNKTDFMYVADWTHRTVLEWDRVGYPRADDVSIHDEERFYRFLPHRSLDETEKQLTVRENHDELQSMLSLEEK